jgi:SAM-dependent methyltransferase
MNAYKKLCTEYYDISKPHAPENAIKFYAHHLEVSNGPVLEPMCGSGRFLIPLLRQGNDVDGVDASLSMLKACRTRCQNIGLKPRLYHQFLHELNLPRQYGAAFIPDGSFCLIANKLKAIDSLQQLYQNLLPGGKLILEILTPRAQTKNPERWIKSQITRPDSSTIILSCYSTYDKVEKTEQVTNRYELLTDGHITETELEKHSIRYYEQEELQRLLKSNGFVDIRVNGIYKDNEPNIKDGSIMVQGIKSLM